MRLPDRIDTPLRTALALVVLPVALLVYASAAICLALLGASVTRLHGCYVSFARVCLVVGGTSLGVRGADELPPGGAYVVISNHESAWDPVCLVAALPHVVLRFVVKRALMRIPVFGRALRMTGNVTVLRTHTEGDVERIREGMAHRDPRVSMLFFAEGTRSRDRELHPFKMGAFATAIAYRLPVLPLAVAGTFDIWPKGTLRVRRRRVAVEVGQPISVEGRDFEGRAALRDECHGAVARLRERAHEQLHARAAPPQSVGNGSRSMPKRSR